MEAMLTYVEPAEALGQPLAIAKVVRVGLPLAPEPRRIAGVH